MEYTAFELSQIVKKMEQQKPPTNTGDCLNITISRHEDFLDGNVDEDGHVLFRCSEEFAKNGFERMVTLKSKCFVVRRREGFQWTFSG